MGQGLTYAPEPDTDTEPETDTVPETETEPETEPDTATETEPDTGTETEPETEPETDTGFNNNTQAMMLKDAAPTGCRAMTEVRTLWTGCGISCQLIHHVKIHCHRLYFWCGSLFGTSEGLKNLRCSSILLACRDLVNQTCSLGKCGISVLT